MSGKLDIIFNGNEKVLRTVNNGDPLVSSLAIPSEEACSLFGKEIKLGEMIGQGSFGKAFLIDVPGKGKRKYVVKRGDVEVISLILNKSGVMKKNIPEEMWRAFNPGFNMSDFDKKSLLVNVPEDFGRSCLTNAPRKFERIPEGTKFLGMLKDKETVVPAGSYLCETNTYSEYFIGAMVGEAYRKGECINFFDVYSMFTCPADSPKKYYQYIVMDKIDGEFEKGASCSKASTYLKHVPDDHIFDVQRGVFIQTMFAIAFYQSKYQLSHNDLHTNNLFVEYVTDETQFNDEFLIEAEWYHYHLSEAKGDVRDVYFPAIPVVAKIGDFGLSVKYSEPIVGDITVFRTGYDQYDGDGPWIPNVYIPSYDAIYFANYYNNLIQGDPEDKKKDTFLGNCLEYLMKGDVNIINWHNFRPYLNKIEGFPTAEDLLRSDVVQKQFGQKPKSGKIVTLGVL